MKNIKKIIKSLIIMLMIVFLFYCNNYNNCNAGENNIFITDEEQFSIFKNAIQNVFNKHNNTILSVKHDFPNKLFDLLYKKENVIIGIIGETASGKSTFVKEAQKSIQSLGIPISFVNADNYYKDTSHIVKRTNKDISTLVKNGELDLDCPEAFNLELLKSDLLKLRKNIKILSPKYSMDGTGISLPHQIPVESNNIIIVEGIASAYEDIYNIFDITIYVDIDDNVRKDRFMNRSKEREIKEDNANEFWNKVFEAGKKYIKPRKNDVDIIINGEFNINTIDELINDLKQQIYGI